MPLAARIAPNAVVFLVLTGANAVPRSLVKNAAVLNQTAIIGKFPQIPKAAVRQKYAYYHNSYCVP